MPEPTLSVIVPFHDGADRLRACLAGLASSSAAHELILVDDASTDPVAIELARSGGARYVRLDTNSGPAAARNAGARIASGEILAFVDSDVVVQPDSLAKLRAVLALEPDVGAVFGSYDAAPASPGTVSRYRNLMHHFYHQTGPREATTFWAGCGAMRRAVFERAGGFDERYRHPSIEDVELGVRLHAAGVPIRLRPDIQCKHLKRWRLLEMVRVDVTRRAIPWTRLMIERPGIGRDLNLAPAQRLCVVLVFLALALVPAGALAPELRSTAAWLWLPLAALAPVVWINRRLYGLFLRHGGALFALQAFLLHLLYYVYGGLAWGWGQLAHRLGAKERAAAALVAWLGAWAAACGGDEPSPATRPAPVGAPSTAKVETWRLLEEARHAPLHASDGGGRAWLEGEGESAVVAGETGRWTLVYEAGPLGIAEGGALYLQVSPFWGWSSPQVVREDALGFTRVTTDAAEVRFEVATVGEQLLEAKLRGRALREGERVRVEYGAGPAGARADAYAERGSRLWIAVDGDGDGVRKLLADSPGVDVLPGPPAMLVLSVPSTARPGESASLHVALLDARGNAGCEVDAVVELLDPPAALELPQRLELAPSDRGRKSLEVGVREPGTYRLRARAKVGSRELEGESNPLVVSEHGPRILWADLHGHSAQSDGTGTPDDYYAYARDVAGLDAAALTDHDHWGMLFLDTHPALWEENRAAAERFDEPGRFVAIAGYEWTSWIHGHRHVLYFSSEAPLFSSMEEPYSTPQGLWTALRGRAALTVPHHVAGGPIALDWTAAGNPELEPLVEVVSAHGSSEADDSPKRIYSAVPGHFARDALGRGLRLGFIGSGDGHDGHPGLAHLGGHYPTGGLAAILSEERTRGGIFEALRARRVYATSGPRIVLRFALGGARMGSIARAAELAPSANLYVHAIGTAPIAAVEVIRSGTVSDRYSAGGQLEVEATAAVDGLKAGEFVYVRVEQEDGGLAWSSPIFVEP
jgi:hypothetical protein